MTSPLSPAPTTWAGVTKKGLTVVASPPIPAPPIEHLLKLYKECVAGGVQARLVLCTRKGTERASFHCSSSGGAATAAAATAAATAAPKYKRRKNRPANERRRDLLRERRSAWEEKRLHPSSSAAAAQDVGTSAAALAAVIPASPADLPTPSVIDNRGSTAAATAAFLPATAADSPTPPVISSAASATAAILVEAMPATAAESATTTPLRKKKKAIAEPTRYSSRTAVTSKRKAAASPEIQRDAPDLDPDDLDLTLELDSNIRCDLDSGMVFPESAEIPALIPPEAPHLYRPFKKGYKGLPKHPNMFICSSCFKSWHRINQFQCTKCDERYGHLSQRPTVHKSLHFSCL
jgi:hypothetical protein